MADPDYLLTPAEIARSARLHRKTIYRFIQDSKLPARLVGGRYRILASDAEELLGFKPERPRKRRAS